MMVHQDSKGRMRRLNQLPTCPAAWTSWPDSASTSSARAQELPSWLLLRDADLQWSDVLPTVRSLVALYGGRILSLPYAVEVPLVLYRR